MSEFKAFVRIGLLSMLPIATFFWFGATYCRHVEIVRQPVTYHLIISGSTDRSAVWIESTPGRVKIEKQTSGIFEIRLPLLHGGYSEFLFFKYNRHLPGDYKIIVITEGEQVVTRLSASEIQNLPRDEAGNFIVTLK